MESNNLTSPPPAVGDSRPGIMALITRVFTEPSKAFGHLTKKTDWIIPLIIIAIIGSTAGYFIRPIAVKDMMPKIRQNMEQYRAMIPPERYQQIMDDLDKQEAEAAKNEYKWYYPLIGVGFPFVMMLFITLVALITGNFIFGGKSSFWIVFNVVAFAALIGLLGDVVRNALVIYKDSYWVHTGLGLLRPVDDGSLLFYLFRQIDIFSIWRIVVTCFGLGVIYNKKTAKFASIIFPVWVIFILIVAVLNKYVMSGGLVY